MNAIPEGNQVIASLMVNGAAKAIELYKKAFGAQEIYRVDGRAGKIMHACIMIGNSKLFLGDTDPESGCGEPSVSSFYVYVNDVDAAFKQAKLAGMQETFAVQDMFWGDRMGNLKDPFGNSWSLATHVRDVSPEEIEREKQKWMKAA
jgi:PhnB protein